MIHHDADGDDDGTYEKFEININEPEGADKSVTNTTITGGKDLQGDLETNLIRNQNRFEVM